LQNQREYSILQTENFGKIVQMEVGAMMVGKIVNHNLKKFKRGIEKGYFLFGGSTVVLMIKEGIVEIDSDIIGNSRNSIETKVRALETIGRRIVK
jgi:phosphatidylserine decarboxylase